MTENFILSDGAEVSVSKIEHTFELWTGDPITDSYGNKAVIAVDDRPLFAELAILEHYKKDGWDGVWVDTYRKTFRVGLPEQVAPVTLPPNAQKIVDDVIARNGTISGFWDVFLWKDGTFLFVESKRKSKDSIRSTQIKWLEIMLGLGFDVSQFVMFEWDLTK